MSPRRPTSHPTSRPTGRGAIVRVALAGLSAALVVGALADGASARVGAPQPVAGPAAASADVATGPDFTGSAPGTALPAGLALGRAARTATTATTMTATTTTTTRVPARTVSLGVTGRGTYHAVGLGQWGALGYAVEDGWSADQILDRYYGGTVPAVVRAPQVTMLLTALSDHQTAVVHERGGARVLGDPQKRRFSSLVAREVAPRVYDVWGRVDATVCPTATDDLSGWVKVLSGVGPQVTFRAAPNRPATRDISRLLGVCEPGGNVRYYRGSIRAVNNADGGNRTINVVKIDLLLRSTVAWEMAPSWAGLGGGRGVEALRAQAVAARSYILAYAWYPHARSCDNICVAYRGAASRVGGPTGTLVLHEDPRTDAAVTSTAGMVRRRGSSTGPIALTMYSASTGGYTAPASGLASFPLVEDAGDDYRAGLSGGNPWRNWRRTVQVSTIEARWPQIGTLSSITFVRNGLGEWGGRVTSVTLTGSTGSVQVAGDTFPRAMGLPSNWFAIDAPA